MEGVTAAAPYAKWRDQLSESQFLAYRARYAALTVLTDRWLGVLLDTMDELALWQDTLVILTTDHGTFNGDHGRIGKLQTHEFDAVGHIPFVVAYPGARGGERRGQLVQLVDIYPTVLSAVGRPLPDAPIHGMNILPVLEDPSASTRPYALMGQFGCSVSITDGEWVLHQSPVPSNQPLYWHGYCLAKFLPYDLGQFVDGRRRVFGYPSWPEETWLSRKSGDMNELVNLAHVMPDKLCDMQRALRRQLVGLGAPSEQLERLGLTDD